jgi:hypothetical protein
MCSVRPLVFFGVDERLVDELLDRIWSSGLVPEKCLVFGTDMPLLGALDSQWRRALGVTIVHMPRIDEHLLEAASLIMASEGIAPETVVWVHANGLTFNAPSGLHAAVHADVSAAELERALANLLG